MAFETGPFEADIVNLHKMSLFGLVFAEEVSGMPPHVHCCAGAMYFLFVSLEFCVDLLCHAKIIRVQFVFE